jgi:hypothetical protein
LFIDCSKIAKAKSDAAVISELADQTGGRLCTLVNCRILIFFAVDRLLARFLVGHLTN